MDWAISIFILLLFYFSLLRAAKNRDINFGLKADRDRIIKAYLTALNHFNEAVEDDSIKNAIDELNWAEMSIKTFELHCK